MAAAGDDLRGHVCVESARVSIKTVAPKALRCARTVDGANKRVVAAPFADDFGKAKVRDANVTFCVE